MKRIRYNQIVLFILAVLFIAPGLFAYFFYLHPEWLGDTLTNKGRLLKPPILFADLKFSTPVNASVANQRFSSRLIEIPTGPKWHMILWSPTACEQSCKVELDKLARIRLALGRHLYEVDSQLLLGPNTPPLPDKLITTLQEQGVGVQKLSARTVAHMPILQNRLAIFIANPKNYLVLAYEAYEKPDDIFHDIKRLLKK